MIGVSSGLITSTTPGAAILMAVSAPAQPPPPPQEAPESGGSSEGGGGSTGGGDVVVGSGGGFNEEGERNSSGNRWPRQETLSLLKIRSEMDVVFKDSSLKGPLWEEVSRKMADLGYHRSGKKCKEKFENVYKYHRRTKEGRASKADGKTYRFFDQLQALENNPASHSLPLPPLAATPITMAMPMRLGNASVNPPVLLPQNNVSSVQNHPFVVSQNNVVTATAPAVNHPMNTPALPLSQPQPQPQPAVRQLMANLNHINHPQGNRTSFLSNSTSSSSTSSDEDIQRRHMKKRKWKEFFESLMKDVIEKQEELQKKFMEILEKRERDRMEREETWRVQEMARLKQEHDLLVQERSMAAAKDATIIAFLQKITEQQNTPIPNSTTTNTSPTQIHLKLPEQPSAASPHSQPPQTPLPQPPPPPSAITVSLPMTTHTQVSVPTPQTLTLPMVAKSFESPKTDDGGEHFSPASSSRWPKEEIEALISLRTCLDLKYQENGPKGPLWEEISAGMRKIGYNRNAKRCKEKWENINKYFKKVKESNKKRPQDSKTCPYFNQLEALYKEKSKSEVVQNTAGFGLRPENSTIPIVAPPPIMAQPEQQWPLAQNHQPQLQQQGITNDNNNHAHHDNHESDSMNHNEDDDDMDEDDDEEDEHDGYEIVTNKQPSSIAAATVTTTTAAASAAVTAV